VGVISLAQFIRGVDGLVDGDLAEGLLDFGVGRRSLGGILQFCSFAAFVLALAKTPSRKGASGGFVTRMFGLVSADNFLGDGSNC
jgi:hypothetical protein